MHRRSVRAFFFIMVEGYSPRTAEPVLSGKELVAPFLARPSAFSLTFIPVCSGTHMKGSQEVLTGAARASLSVRIRTYAGLRTPFKGFCVYNPEK